MEAGRLTVLYVDDDYNDLALFGAAAEKTNLDIWVHTATAVQQAIELLEGRGSYAERAMHPLPDVILLDLLMPPQSGFDFLEWHRHSAFKSIPVIAFCGSSYEVDRQRALALGASFFIEKPAGFEDLQQVVRRIWSLGMKLRPGTAPENRGPKSEVRSSTLQGSPKPEVRGWKFGAAP
jgi:CheY-like chemotaxis protein